MSMILKQVQLVCDCRNHQDSAMEGDVLLSLSTALLQYEAPI